MFREVKDIGDVVDRVGFLFLWNRVLKMWCYWVKINVFYIF